ncbi:hypothetical protein ACWD5R_25205 [Streptomyces sp. NPDC002514]|uniref:hypothetical protein n=1 Tax=Streptomyces sp. NPDC001270 TaxID=3364554 RepID=UPI0036BB47D4
MTGQELSGRGEGVSLVTCCGRRIAVKCFTLATPENPISRVTLDVGKDRDGEPGTWASLTADEARGLAHLLLAEAARAERSGR